ncbi:MAG: hypothetical protein AAGA85_01200 [Bacteroidota bacterium]
MKIWSFRSSNKASHYDDNLKNRIFGIEFRIARPVSPVCIESLVDNLFVPLHSAKFRGMQNFINLALGCVVYTETQRGVEADWIYCREGKVERGKGMGVRLTHPKDGGGFEGTFEVSYQDEAGNESPKLLLTIIGESGYYALSWSREGQTTDVGIGVMSDDKLVVSYTEIK